MAWNPQMYYPYQPYQPLQNPQQSGMTPPTIHAEIVQVDSEEAANNYPVGVGASQMMMAKDDSAIYVKSVTQNGYTLDVFTKRPPAPVKPPIDLAEYVTKEELEARLAAFNAPKKAKKEADE